VKVSREDVLRIARLARLEVAPGDVDALAEELDDILEYAEKLEKLDSALRDVEPMTHAAPGATPLRDDVEAECLGSELTGRGAPALESGSFVVPRVIE
jgi:aspartyl-tRNA(Asn)/glutamyl-tRNA(Gln) amidotransferase subunit C